MRSRRLFFCQIEAVETIIYLREVLEQGRKPRWNPKLSVAEFKTLKLSGGKPKPEVVYRKAEDALLTLAGEWKERFDQAARRWVAAVNHWGRLGTWDFLACRDPQLLRQTLSNPVTMRAQQAGRERVG